MESPHYTPDLSPDPSPSEPARQPLLRRPNLLREIVETALLTTIAFLLINAATGRFKIESVSMQPNLHEGEYVIVDKVSYRLGIPQRGDIVVFSIEGETRDLIKRVIGLPGETIEMSNGIVTIDGQLLDEPYVASPSGGVLPARQLGADEYFVMGDNRGNSKDSRVFGPIRSAAIVGRAWIIYWPVADWGFVPRPVYATGDEP